MVTLINERGLEMHDPPHPGEVLRGLYLEPLGFTVRRTNIQERLLGYLRRCIGALDADGVQLFAAGEGRQPLRLTTSWNQPNDLRLLTLRPILSHE